MKTLLRVPVILLATVLLVYLLIVGLVPMLLTCFIADWVFGRNAGQRVWDAYWTVASKLMDWSY